MDFQELKNKVDKERERRLSEGEARGDVMPQRNAPKDSLLHELQLSLQTGRPSKMVENMKQVDRVANSKLGASGRPPQTGGGLGDALSQHIGAAPKNNYPPQQQHPQQPRQQMNEQVNPRDAAFDQQFQQRPSSQGSLSEQLAQMSGNGGYTQNPQQQMMDAYKQMHGTNQPMQQYPQQQNNNNAASNQVNEQVNQALKNVDFGSLLQESLKNTVMEMYAMEKIQKSLLENKDVIKKIVKETLIELSQSKKKSTN